MPKSDETLNGYRLEDYRVAPSGLGPLAAQWDDKPHRLVYDLVTALEEARREREALAEPLEAMVRRAKYDGDSGVWTIQSSSDGVIATARAALAKAGRGA